jgi:putative NADH-flavin reductase
MKVTLFGATGKTGPYLISEGLRRGFELTVFARPNSRFANADVRVVRGELNDIALLREAIRGSDSVISELGPAKQPHPKGLPITAATKAIISAMEWEQVKRLIAVSTGTAVDPGDGFDLKIWLPAALIKLAMPNAYQDMIGLANTIRASQLDWTMVRAAVLKNRPASEHLNVGLYGHTKHSLTVSREDLVAFMFDQRSNRDFIHKAPGISSRR